MYKLILNTFVVCASLFALEAYAQAPNLEAMDIVTRSVPDGPVARVGKESIEKIDFIALYETELARFAARNSEESVSDGNRVRLALMCVNILVEHELLHQYGLAQKVTVPQEKVTEQAEKQLEAMRSALSEELGKEVSNADIFERLGYASHAEVDAEVERAMVISKVRDQIVRDYVANVSPEELDRIYEKNLDKFVQPDGVHCKQIFVRANMKDEISRTQGKKKADEALSSVFSGQRFEAVAKDFSDLPKQVDMGFVPLERIPDFLRTPLASMKPADVSDVIESSDGFHIVTLVASKGGEKLSKEEVEGTIRAQMGARQGGSVIRDFCDDLIAKGNRVQVFLELEENLARVGGETALE